MQVFSVYLLKYLINTQAMFSFEKMSKRVKNLSYSLVGTWLTCGVFKYI